MYLMYVFSITVSISARLFISQLYFTVWKIKEITQYCAFYAQNTCILSSLVWILSYSGAEKIWVRKSWNILPIRNSDREYWMLYRVFRGPGYLAVFWFGSSPIPSPPLPLDRRHTGRLRKRDDLLTWEGEGVGDTYDRKKSWSSIKSFNTVWPHRTFSER